MQKRKCVLSITSAALESDTRTLRFAQSIARAGYNSLVVEGTPSRDTGVFGLPVVSLDTRALASAVSNEAATALGAVRQRLRHGTGIWPVNAALAAAYKSGFWWKYGYSPERRVPHADLYILHNFFFFPLVLRRLRKKGTPFIYDAHDFYSASHNKRTSPFDKLYVDPFLLKVEKWCCREAARVTTVSDGVAKLMLAGFGRLPDVLHNVQDIRTMEASRFRDMRGELNLPQQAFVVVIIGNYKSAQAVELLLSAVQLVDDRIHVVFVGAGYEPFAPRCVQLSIKGRVHFAGLVPATDLFAFVRGADAAALIRPVDTINDRVALPNGFFQAIAVGLPLILGNNQPEVVGISRKYGLGLEVDPSAPLDIARALGRLVEDSALRTKLRNASERARMDLCWEREESRLLELVDQVLQTSDNRFQRVSSSG